MRHVNAHWPRLHSEWTFAPARSTQRDLCRAVFANLRVLKVNHIRCVQDCSYRVRSAKVPTGCRPDRGNNSIPMGASSGSRLPWSLATDPLGYQWTRWFSPLGLARFWVVVVVSSSSCRVSCVLCSGVCMHGTFRCSIKSRGCCVACLLGWWCAIV